MSKAKTSTIFDDKLEMINLDDIKIIHPRSKHKPQRPTNLYKISHGKSYAKEMDKHNMEISDYFDTAVTISPSDDREMELLENKGKIIVITYPKDWFINSDIISGLRSDDEEGVETGLVSIEEAIVDAGFAKYREYKRRMKMRKSSKKRSKQGPKKRTKKVPKKMSQKLKIFIKEKEGDRESKKIKGRSKKKKTKKKKSKKSKKKKTMKK
tara:strand:+ start:46 stop:675 length:630 start_codon:yes stop_codon:yes gene_type:complete